MESWARDLPIYHSGKDKEDISEVLTYEPRILNYIAYKSKLSLSETYTWAWELKNNGVIYLLGPFGWQRSQN